MALNENALWNTLSTKLRTVPQFKFQRHEDRYSKGIPDSSFSGMGFHGWIELKHLSKWPARANTVVRIDHYTQDQKIWIKEHGERGGLVWLFVQVGDTWLLFDWQRAQQVGELTRVEMLNTANRVWNKKLPILELLSCIIQRVPVE